MKVEEFFSELNSRSSSDSAHSIHLPNLFVTRLDEVQKAANRGLRVFPVPPIAKLTANPDRLIAEATTEISRVAELVAELGTCCDWRAVVDPSQCVVRLDGTRGRKSVATLSHYDQEQCLTLRVHRGDSEWAVFCGPKSVTQRVPSRKLAPGVTLLSVGDSYPIPPSVGCAWFDPLAEIETIPFWLRELAFESPDSPAGKVVSVPSLSPCPSLCKSINRFEKPHRGTRKAYPTCDQAGWRAGYRVSRRR